MDALVGSLDDVDGFLRYKIIAAIEDHQARQPRAGRPGPGRGGAAAEGVESLLQGPDAAKQPSRAFSGCASHVAGSRARRTPRAHPRSNLPAGGRAARGRRRHRGPQRDRERRADASRPCDRVPRQPASGQPAEDPHAAHRRDAAGRQGPPRQSVAQDDASRSRGHAGATDSRRRPGDRRDGDPLRRQPRPGQPDRRPGVGQRAPVECGSERERHRRVGSLET